MRQLLIGNKQTIFWIKLKNNMLSGKPFGMAYGASLFGQFGLRGCCSNNIFVTIASST